jgi:hypothetical protein
VKKNKNCCQQLNINEVTEDVIFPIAIGIAPSFPGNTGRLVHGGFAGYGNSI